MKKKPPNIVTLITDFGCAGEYGGAMKGAILKVNPRCQVVDITHRIEPQNLLQASFVLSRTYPYYPVGTVHLVVVDPGVGTRRRPLVLRKGGHLFVGPDNGVFTALGAGEGTEAYEITARKFFLSPLSATFHGRDLFGPVAGRLSLGKDPGSFGPPVADRVGLPWPEPRLRAGKLRGRVLWADGFGNLVTNISAEFWAQVAGRPMAIRGRGWAIERIDRTYADVEFGRPLALFGSSGLLELAINGGSALRALGLRSGDPVTIALSLPGRRKHPSESRTRNPSK